MPHLETGIEKYVEPKRARVPTHVDLMLARTLSTLVQGIADNTGPYCIKGRYRHVLHLLNCTLISVL